MNKFQNLKFTSLDDFFNFLPAKELEIVLALRELVFSAIPNCKEKLSYNVPFYSVNKAICFIWPGSVPWGNKVKQGVEIGFAYGSLLTDIGYLNIGTRKRVAIKTLYSIKDIDANLLSQLLLEAYAIDKLKLNAKFI